MSDLLEVTLLGFVAGCIGTGIGGAASFFIPKNNKRHMGFVLELSAGLMLSVVCFELLPEAFAMSGIFTGMFGVFLGVVSIILVEEKLTSLSSFAKISGQNSFLYTGILLLIGVALHNFPEGIAIGSAFEASEKLGFSLVIIIGIHNIPEGFAIGSPMKASGWKNFKIFFYTILSGIPMGFGAFLGRWLGTISADFISACLGFAGGAMLYIVCGELIPKSKSIYQGRFSSLGNILGIILGILLSKI